MRILARFLVVLIMILGVAGCNVVNLSGNEQLPAISSLPLPKLPNWIEQISPIGEAAPLNQIRIRFKEALIPVESLDSPTQQQLLQKFEVIPLIPGRFRFLTPRMVGFQADKALPKATRFKVTLKAGLADLKNHRLEQDLAWTFNTEPIKITNLPNSKSENSEIQAFDLNPTLKFTSNVELDLNSTQEHLQLFPEGKTKVIKFKVNLETEETPVKNEESEEKFDPLARNWIYKIIPNQNLEKAKTYRLEVASGLRPAKGNLTTNTAFVSKIETYSPLSFEKIEYYGIPDAGGTYGRFIKGSPQLKFNNGLVADSAIENITITPKPKQAVKLIQAYDHEKLVGLNPWALEPATNYTITIGANLKDQFGQTLGKPVSFKYNTGDVAGDIQVPSGLHIFPSDHNLQLNITTVNLPESRYKAAYKVVQPTDLVYTDSAYPSGKETDLIPNLNSGQSFRVSNHKNQPIDATVPIKEKLGAATGMLVYGVQAKTNNYYENGKQKARESTTYGMVQLTNLGVFSQLFPESGFIRVHHLSDGAPVAAASVEIYQSQLESKSRSQPAPCTTGKTDQNGTLLLSTDNLKKCLKPNAEQAPELLIIAYEGKDWAFTRSQEYSGAYGYGIDADWDSGKPISRGVVFSDRQLYQPGEKAAFTGFAYYLQKGELTQDKNAAYKITLLSPDGKKTELGTQTTNEFGTFSLELSIQNNQPLGYYTIQAKKVGETVVSSVSSSTEISGEFRIAEFKSPNFKVSLNLDKEFAFPDDKIAAKAESNYLFGSPVEGGKAQYYVTRQQAYFTPKGWEQFSFGRQWLWPEENPVVPTDVLQLNQVLDGQGKNNQIVTVGKDLPYPMTYRVDVQISDVSNLSVSDSKTFTALPSDRLIGLKSNFVADANKPFPIEVIVTNPTGNIIEGQRVRLELQQMKYSSVTRLVEGGETAKDQVEYKTVAQTEVQSATTPASVSLTPPESGSYRIRANFTDTRDEVTATDLQVWVTGDNAVAWGSEEKNRLAIKLDKETYKPGETATALIQSPYADAELYFAIVRDKPLYETITKVKGGAPQIQFQVTPEMLPNAAVQAVLVRQGVPLSQVEPGSVENLVRIGFTPFTVNLEEKYLKIAVTPGQEKVQPGTEQTLQLTLKDNQGNPTQGQFTVMVVNEAVLQLSGYHPPNLVETVYAAQPISLRFSDNRPDVVVQPSKLRQKGWGYGGGFSAAAANTRIRKDFQPLAYYNGALLTDANGQASVNFKLPDDLTTWRIMVVATDGKFRFGNGESTFMTTKPLIANPILPQFARPGDRFLSGLSVTNNTGKTGNLAINGNVLGSLRADNNHSLQTPAESGTRAYRFPVVAEKTGEGKVQFVSQLDGIADAFEVPLQVKPLEVTEEVVETGKISHLNKRGEEVKIPLNIDRNVVADEGGLEVSLASTLIPEITAPAKQVLEKEELPFLEPLASQLAIASSLQTISLKYNQSFANFNPVKQAAQSLAELQKLQMPDGGFAAYPKQKKSDPFLTPYAAESIAKASSAGITVDADMVNRLRSYLKKILANPGQYDFCNNQLCKNQVRLSALIALNQFGEKQNDFLADIYQQRNEFDLVTQIKLARYLSLFPEWQPEYQSLMAQLQENIYQTGRTATVSLPQSWRWMSSPTTTQAQFLRLAIAQNTKPEILDSLLQSLLALRRKGTWQNTYDNAEALTALVEYSKLQPTSPNFTATVQLAGKKLAESRFKGYNNPNIEVKVPTRELPKGRHELILKKRGEGNLHYLVSYRYRLPGNQPGRFNGLRVDREIRAANQEKVLRKIGMYNKEESLTVAAGQVYDIGLEIIADHPVERVLITDYLPAGFETVDNSFATSTPALQSQADSWQIGFRNIYRDRIVAYSDRFEPGVYSLHYLVRAVTPGTFLWPGANVHLQYAPEEFGRSAASSLVVKEP